MFFLRFLLVTTLIFFTLVSSSSSVDDEQSCTKFVFPDNKYFDACVKLPVLDSFIHWRYNSSSNILDIAYRRTGFYRTKWVSWAVNPTSKGMVGSQAIISYQKPDGSMAVYTSPITSYSTLLRPGNLSFPVYDLSATYNNNEITIFATMVLPGNSTNINHVWQDGPVNVDVLGVHGFSNDHLVSMGSLNLASGTTSTMTIKDSKTMLRNIHGALNGVSWGIMMPLGFMIARYLKAFRHGDPLWFKLHVGLQCSAFVIGMAGMATGVFLNSGVHHMDHLAIAITICCLAILQVMAYCVRAGKEHKYRVYWNMYHHYVGYTVLILSIANICIGLNMLNPHKVWKMGYYVILGVLLLSTFFLELCKTLKKDDNNTSTQNL